MSLRVARRHDLLRAHLHAQLHNRPHERTNSNLHVAVCNSRLRGRAVIHPATNQIYATSHIIPAYIGYLGLNASTYFTSPGMNFGQPCPQCGTIASNSTTWAINATTGQIAWHYTNTVEGYRGRTVVSGGVVYLTESSGDIVMLNAQNGKLLRDYYIGAPMDEGISFGASISGQEFILLDVGVCDLEAVSTCPGTTPGDVLALTLSERATAKPSHQHDPRALL